MKKIYHTLILIAVILLTACSNNDVLQSNQPSEKADSVAISFGNYVGRSATRATSISSRYDMLFPGFGVFAYSSSGTYNTSGSNFTANEMDNFQVTGTKDTEGNYTWTYRPLRYWPQGSSEYLSFLAYAPWTDGTELTNSKYLEFTLNTDVSKQVDLLYASADNCQYISSSNKTSYVDENGKVKLTFSHALSRIAVVVTASALSGDNTNLASSKTATETDAKITVNSVTIGANTAGGNGGFYKTGSLRLTDGSWSSKSGRASVALTSFVDGTYTGSTWTPGTVSGVIKGEKESTATSFTASYVGTSEDNNLFVIPENDRAIYCYIDYTVSYSGTGVTKSYNAIGRISTSDAEFDQGKAYVLKIDITSTALPEVSFNVNASDWDSEETVNLDI